MKSSSMRFSAMNFLAMREHSVLELKNKLKNKFPDRFQEIEQLLEELLAENLLNEERFTEVFIRSRMNKGYGPVKISYELALKGIPNDIITYNMQRNEANWFDCLQKAWNKKFSKNFSALTADNNQNKMKQSRYLYQRGFSSDQIKAFFNKQYF